MKLCDLPRASELGREGAGWHCGVPVGLDTPVLGPGFFCVSGCEGKKERGKGPVKDKSGMLSVKSEDGRDKRMS